MTGRHRLLLLLAAALVLSGCGQSNYNWGWNAVLPLTDRGMTNFQFMVAGARLTVQLSVIALFFSVLIGLFVSLAALSPFRFLRVLNRVYVEVFRSIPILVMILWVYYGLPVLVGVNLSPIMAGIIALVASDSAFEAEIFRGGIQSIHKGQHEASDSLGMSYAQKMRYVILPQAITRILPPLGNQFVYMLKMSSLLSVIGVMELTRRANELAVVEYRPLEIYTLLLVEYLVLILIASWLVRLLEKKMRVGQV
ncbi:MAG: amino acid ABC transporter permease [Rhodobacteraceae bacterium]|nr:amino acid ABC transporter permease [Paracoccaceae bacterium]